MQITRTKLKSPVISYKGCLPFSVSTSAQMIRTIMGIPLSTQKREKKGVRCAEGLRGAGSSTPLKAHSLTWECYYKLRARSEQLAPKQVLMFNPVEQVRCRPPSWRPRPRTSLPQGSMRLCWHGHLRGNAVSRQPPSSACSDPKDLR